MSAVDGGQDFYAQSPCLPPRFRSSFAFPFAFLMLVEAPVFRGFFFDHVSTMRCLTADIAH